MDCLVEYDYNAAQNDELTIRKGDIIRNVVPFEDGWKKGYLNGREGVFPDNFVMKLSIGNSKSLTQSDMIAKFKEQLSKNGSKDDLMLHNDNHNYGDCNPTTSPLLASKTRLKENDFNNLPTEQQSKLSSNNLLNRDLYKNETLSGFSGSLTNLKNEFSKTNESQNIVIALFDYKPENADELRLNVGDIIQVVDKNLIDDGWWKGMKKTGEIGIFPCNFVESISETMTKKRFNDEHNIFKGDINSCKELSNLSGSVSFNDLSTGSKTPHQATSNRSQAAKSSTSIVSSNKTVKTKNINANSTAIDINSDAVKHKRSSEITSKSGNNLLKPKTGITASHESSRGDDNSNSLEKSKLRSSRNDSFINEENFISKLDFDKYRHEVDGKLSKLSVRIQTLIEEIDEEKKQRAASEIELVRLRRVVHMLDAQNMSGLI